MREIIKSLGDEISKLETEIESVIQIDVALNKRLLQNQRQTTLKETQLALHAIEINAARRATQELFIYAIPHQAQIVLNANQFYNFRLITLQEIELKSMFNPEDVIKLYWNKTNRLTLYSEFKERANRLIKKIEAEELDEHACYSASELLYQILGIQGELLEHIGIDVSRSYTSTRLNQIIQRACDNLSFFTSWPHDENKD